VQDDHGHGRFREKIWLKKGKRLGKCKSNGIEESAGIGRGTKGHQTFKKGEEIVFSAGDQMIVTYRRIPGEKKNTENMF